MMSASLSPYSSSSRRNRSTFRWISIARERITPLSLSRAREDVRAEVELTINGAAASALPILCIKGVARREGGTIPFFSLSLSLGLTDDTHPRVSRRCFSDRLATGSPFALPCSRKLSTLSLSPPSPAHLLFDVRHVASHYSYFALPRSFPGRETFRACWQRYELPLLSLCAAYAHGVCKQLGTRRGGEGGTNGDHESRERKEPKSAVEARRVYRR